MICPLCGQKGNLPGDDWCRHCQFDLMAIDIPMPVDRVERSLMMDPVSALGPREPVLLSAKSNLGHAIQLMLSRKVGAVLLTDDVNSLVGILTERDFLTKIAGRPHYDDEPIADYMTRHPETVRATDTISYALGKMAGGGYRHLPVVAGKSPVGIVSVRDVLKHMTSLCNDSVS